MDWNRRIMPLGFAVALGLAFLAPAPAEAQLSPITTQNLFPDAPMFGRSALVLNRGGISAGGDFHYLVIDDEGDEGIDITGIQLAGNLAFGVTDRITVGANLPFLYFSAESGDEEESTSGLLDIDVYGQAQLFRTTDGRTMMSGFFVALLPTTDDGIFDDLAGTDVEVDRDPSYSVGAAVTHRRMRTSFHGSAAYLMGGDATFGAGDFTFESEGTNAIQLTGAALFGVTDRMKADGEILFNIPTGDEDDEDEADTETTLAGGLRFLASQSIFIDGGVSVPVSDSPLDASIYVGVTWVR